ncbi:MAG: glycosyltransferase family 39 protein [Anaerolineaceae bacterium]|nr:glycosyltransferase family 39 protein [Anaerolineaceae bacterium]
MISRKFLLAGVFLVAIVTRCLFIGSRTIEYDDAFSIFLSQQTLSNIVHGTAADTMPPLYYFLLHYWMFLGQQVWLLRSFSILLNLGSVFLLYWIVKDLVDWKAGLWAALLAAISPLQIYHAQDLRMYALLELGQLGYIWFFSQIWKNTKPVKKDWKNWLGLVFCGGLAMYSHNLAIFVLVVPNLYLIFKRSWRLLFRLIAAQLVIGLLALPWLLYLPGQISKIQGAFWTPRPGFVEVLQAIIMFTAALPLSGIVLIVAAVLSVEILFIVVMEAIKDRENKEALGFLACYALLPPILIFIISYVMRPVFVPRGFLVSSMAYYGIAGIIISKNWPKGVGVLTVATFGLAAVISLPSQYLLNTFPRSPYQQAMSYLETVIQPGEQIIHDDKLSYFPSRYYSPDLPQKFLADKPGSPNDTFAPGSQKAMDIFPQPDLAVAIADSQQFYFVVYTQTIQEYKAAGLADHPNLTWLRARYMLLGKKTFNDLEIYHFSRQGLADISP